MKLDFTSRGQKYKLCDSQIEFCNVYYKLYNVVSDEYVEDCLYSFKEELKLSGGACWAKNEFDSVIYFYVNPELASYSNISKAVEESLESEDTTDLTPDEIISWVKDVTDNFVELT